ncbi:MAG: DUF599 family protein [Pseudomonadales bacterium]
MTELSSMDWLSLLWFFLCWIGYNYFSRFRAKKVDRLQNMLQRYIEDWIAVLHKRDVRIVDTSVIANMERNASFLASSCLLVIAGLLTVLGSTDRAINLLGELPFVTDITRQGWELKLLMLSFIYVYAFFTFTWCMRQYGFASVLIGNAPLYNDPTVTPEQRTMHIETLSRVVGLAVYSFNLGLRAYYFSLALLVWFIHPLAFVVATAWVVGVLFRREFQSKTLRTLMAGRSNG